MTNSQETAELKNCTIVSIISASMYVLKCQFLYSFHKLFKYRLIGIIVIKKV